MYVSTSMWRGNSKTTSNTVSIIANDVTTDSVTASQVTTSGITATSGLINVLTMITSYTTEANIYNARAANLFINGIKFEYSTGSWDPQLGIINSDGTGITKTYTNQDGYYIRTGSNVTVFFDLSLTVNFAVGVSNNDKFATIANLPFEIGGAVSDGKVQASKAASVVEYPNGYAGPVPSIPLPVFSGPYILNAYETGLAVPLSVFYVSYGTWTSSGRDLVITCAQNVFTVALTVPPWANVGSSDGNASFLWFASATTYPIRISGSLTYAIA